MAQITMEDLEMLASHHRLVNRHPRVCHLGKIMSAGSMLGTALLFPFTYSGDLPFRALTLTIFTVSLVVLVAIHLEPFVRFGLYTGPLAVFILLVLVLPGGPPSQSDIKPWLPLYVVFFCSLTAIIHQPPFRITRSQASIVAQVPGGLPTGPAPMPAPGYHDYRTSSEWSGPRPPSQSYRNDPNSFDHMGPGSSRSVQTGSGGTEFTLRPLDDARRDPHSAFIYGNSHTEPGHLASDNVPSFGHRGETYESAADMELGHVRPSQDSALESRAPLLGSYD